MRRYGRKSDFCTPPPGKVLSAARPCMHATKKDQGGRVTNENVCVSGFQRFGFEPEPERAAPGSDDRERCRLDLVRFGLRYGMDFIRRLPKLRMENVIRKIQDAILAGRTGAADGGRR